LGTVFFTVLSHEGFAPALRHAMWWQVGLLGVTLVISPLLPRHALQTPVELVAESAETPTPAAV
ncbi:MAG: hypothetical protein ACR2ND_08500, partial [Solirubrobacteraceae bacterium]